MGIIKGINIEAIEAPKIAEVKPLEKPIFEFRAENYFPVVGKVLQGDLAESGLRLKEMAITPDLSKNSGVKFSDLSLTETRTHTTISPKLAIATIALAGAAGVVIKNPEIAVWVVDRIKALGSFLSLSLLPIFGMVMGDGKKTPDPVLASIAEELNTEANDLERSAQMYFNEFWDGAAEKMWDRIQKLRQEAKEVLQLKQSETIVSENTTNIEGLGRIPFLSEIKTRGPGLKVSTTALRSTSTDRFLGTSSLPYPSWADALEGYQLKAGLGEDAVTLKIKTIDRRTIELIHQQFSAEYERTGSAKAALNSLMRMPWDPSLFEMKSPYIGAFRITGSTSILSRPMGPAGSVELLRYLATMPPDVKRVLDNLFQSSNLEYVTADGKRAQYAFSEGRLSGLRFSNEPYYSLDEKRHIISDPLLGDADVGLVRDFRGGFYVYNGRGDVKILRDTEGATLEIPVPPYDPSVAFSFKTLDPNTDILVINGMRFYFMERKKD